jgi:hypothetical protein
VQSQLEQRVRRIAVVVPVLAVAATIFGALPGGLEHWTDGYIPAPVVHATFAGGWSLVAWTLSHAFIAYLVYDKPTQRHALGWFAVSIVTVPVAWIAWSVEHSLLLENYRLAWAGNVTATLVGAAQLLLLVGLPIVAATSERGRPIAAVARLR